MHRVKSAAVWAIIAMAVAIVPAFADIPVPTPIGSEEAFDAVMNQVDPGTGEPARVALIDVRTRAEFFWIGVPSKVDEIVLESGRTYVPDMGKVKMIANGMFLTMRVNHRRRWVPVHRIESITITPITFNIPYKVWNEDTASLSLYANFGAEVDALADDYDVLIFFCRSGGRSQACLADFDTSLFDAYYEIDQPDGKTGRGGFEGTSHSNKYNGYRGFPGRATWFQDHPSVAWKDLGLPIKIGVNPLQ